MRIAARTPSGRLFSGQPAQLRNPSRRAQALRTSLLMAATSPLTSPSLTKKSSPDWSRPLNRSIAWTNASDLAQRVVSVDEQASRSMLTRLSLWTKLRSSMRPTRCRPMHRHASRRTRAEREAPRLALCARCEHLDLPAETIAADDWRAYRPRELASPQSPTEASVC